MFLKTITHESMPDPLTPFLQDLATSRDHEPILAVVLLAAACAGRPAPPAAVTDMLARWTAEATALLSTTTLAPPALQRARRVGQRALRVAQGYDLAAREHGYLVLMSFLRTELGRDLTDAESRAIYHGLRHAFTGYATYLDAAGAPGVMTTGGAR